MPLLEIKNLTVTFDTSVGLFIAVKGIDLSVDAARGAGDRRRVRLRQVGRHAGGDGPAAARPRRSRADRMTFDGLDLLDAQPARQRRKIIGKDIAMIFQEPMASLNPCFTVGFQIEEMLQQHTRPATRRAPRPRHRAAQRGRHPRRRPSGSASFPHQMSGGQCQRVMIAMAIACNPKLLIADEPTTALDVTIQKQILDLLVQLQAEHGMGLIMITHNMGVVAETADRVIVQYKGRKMEEADVLSLSSSAQERLHAGAALGAAGERHRRSPADHLRLLVDEPAAIDDRRSSSKRRNLVRDYHVGGGLFSRPRTVHAVKGVSFTVEKGKTLAIVGESGCGKSTLARIITLIDPRDLGRAPDRRQAGRHRRSASTPRNAPQGADRLPEPLWLAQSAPEDRRRARRAAADQHRHAGRASAATAPWRC